MAPFSALLLAELPIFKACQFSIGLLCHAFGLTILPFISYHLHRFLRRRILGDNVAHDKIDKDTAIVARQLAFINLITVAVVVLIFIFSSESTPGLERLLALLDIALTVAWACVCWIPLELHSHHAGEGSDMMIINNMESCRRSMWTPGLHTILEVAESK